jgi:hypothetical protein
VDATLLSFLTLSLSRLSLSVCAVLCCAVLIVIMVIIITTVLLPDPINNADGLHHRHCIVGSAQVLQAQLTSPILAYPILDHAACFRI